jgi:uncharacterized protein
MASHPPYQQLIAALLKPLLSQPAALRVDCEYMPTHARVWVRISFAEIDQEMLMATGNRHLYATKAVLAAAAREAGQSVHLDLYDPNAGTRKFAAASGAATESRPSNPPISRVARPVRKSDQA